MTRRNLSNGEVIPLEPGERDRAVTLQTLTESVGTTGFPVETWATLATPVWMRKLDASQRERFMAAQISAPIDTQWEMGYREDMDPELVDVTKSRRLLYQSRVYDIVSAQLLG